MGFFSNWPSSNLHNLNLDWTIEQVKKLKILSEQIWERVKPFDGGDPGTITPAQAYTTAILAQSTANQANNSAKAADTSIKQHKSDYNNPHNVTASQVGAAPAFDILPIAKGGTGSNTPDGARASLGARADFTILPVSDGGTGSNTPDGARAALGITPDNIGAIPRGGGSVTGFLTFDGSNGLSWRCADGTSMLLRPYVDGNLFQFILTPQNGSAYSPFSIDTSGAVCVTNLAVGSGTSGLLLWYTGSGCGFTYNVDGITKCSLSLNADGTASLNGKKIVTET